MPSGSLGGRTGGGGGHGGGRAHFTNMELEDKLEKGPLQGDPNLIRVDLDDNISDSIKKKLKFGDDAILSYTAEPVSKEFVHQLKELGIKPPQDLTISEPEPFLGTIIKTES